MATTIYLIRHGETVDADSRRYKGHIDVPLSENGINQLERLAKYLFQNIKKRHTPPIPPLVKGGQGGVEPAYANPSRFFSTPATSTSHNVSPESTSGWEVNRMPCCEPF